MLLSEAVKLIESLFQLPIYNSLHPSLLLLSTPLPPPQTHPQTYTQHIDKHNHASKDSQCIL